MDSIPTGQLRYAIIGAGAAVVDMHRSALELPSVKVVAVSDVNATTGQKRADELHCPFYEDHKQLLAETKPDVVVITTPHPFHAQIAIDALQAGSHVLVEKPIAVQVVEADAMIEAAERAQRTIGVIFQHRFRPEIRTARQFIQDGRLGQLQHITMSAVWTRNASYYRSAGWRGTWRGEGGGVLMNQAPHHLDILCHLVGLPSRVFAWTRRQLHQIETEDTVQASLEWPNGALGSVHISTAEADQAEYFKIVGTRGQLEIQHGKLVFRELETDLVSHIETCTDGFRAPTLQEVSVELLQGTHGNHTSVYQAFNEAIVQGTDYTAAGAEGRMSLELANAFIYANYTGLPVDLPLDRAKYASLLEAYKAH